MSVKILIIVNVLVQLIKVESVIVSGVMILFSV